ncbi:energy-coupling factor transport system ATP-binding protein [Methanocalculus alkaliphilus]|uniref:ABC transporter ATP-binding protein n=1 Tax=Methanocalculus alkaliphilus TaxID=768730 RepID=UPI0020A05F4B|nr:energy-coupling factor ABC transporter ATP-binding protein [Methanocalculus alkaliphilus]MCP1715188.1 energy-coupling factor transport system ATP-binding protein [Methanocalculus alkaliphilus]
MITIHDLSHGILRIPALSIEPGITTILGPNGAGKTTLLSIMAGVIIPETGLVLIDGNPPRSCEVGWVSEFPDRNILFERVFDEIAAPLRFRNLPMEAIETRTMEIAEMLRITRLINRKTRTLSGGEKVLVALATALVTSPLLLVIDEADSHLDEETAWEMQDALRSDPPPYILQSSQYRDIAAVSDDCIMIRDGRVISGGIPRDG